MIRFLPLLLVGATSFAQGTKADYERALTLAQRTESKIFRAHVEPHWTPNGLWYRVEIAPGKFEFVEVDAAKGERRVLSKAPVSATTTPIAREDAPHPSRDGGGETNITFVNRMAGEVRMFWIDGGGKRRSYGTIKPGETFAQQTFAGHVWLAESADGKTLGVWEANEAGGEVVLDGSRPKAAPAPEEKQPEPRREWHAFIRKDNVFIKHRDTGEEVQLSSDGSAEDAYREPLRWSPDGAKLLAMQVQPAQEHKVWLVESSPADQLQPKLSSYDYLKPGDKIAHERPRLFDIASRKPIVVKDDLFPNPWDISEVRWSPDSTRFTFLYNQRGHQLERIVSVDSTSGAARVLAEETSPTFIDYSQKTFAHWLDSANELIWMSERDGWNHLWLYDTRTGAVKNQITRGEWVVRKVERVDEEKRQIWFTAFGIRSGQDPYQAHLVRINFDGTGQTMLTEGDGTHTWQFSPDGRFFIDTWSRVDQPQVTELRRADDGALVCALEKADASPLLATGWRMPERFVAKGRDGKTDIHGIIVRPSSFDPAKKYPIIEKIYAGPHDFFVPKSFGREIGDALLAELGFIVVQIDGMGTNWRSRAFHDVCWKNLKDAGFPDRIAWLRAAAAAHHEMDLDRVGIFGGSAGGQSALGALLFTDGLYKAAVADCGSHDNRMDKIWWNEAWMGWPVGPEYADNSNVTHAKNLTGKLLLTFGELDHNVDPSSSMQVVNALIKADKDFEMLVVPGSDHGAGERPYAARRRMDFFVRSLLGVEPRAQ